MTPQQHIAEAIRLLKKADNALNLGDTIYAEKLIDDAVGHALDAQADTMELRHSQKHTNEWEAISGTYKQYLFSKPSLN